MKMNFGKTLSSLVAGLALACSVSAYAADISPKAMNKIEKDVATMTQVMDLNNQQAEKVKALKTTLFISNRDTRKEYANDPSALKEARKANMRGYQKALTSSVSKKQMQAFRAFRKEQMAQKKKG